MAVSKKQTVPAFAGAAVVCVVGVGEYRTADSLPISLAMRPGSTRRSHRSTLGKRDLEGHGNREEMRMRIYIYVRASEREWGAERTQSKRRKSGEALHLPSPTLSPHTRELRRAPAMRAPSHARARSSSPLTLLYSGRTTCSSC
ncbi:hypothetical protein HPB50_017418 [Hyalomma asiaticum]|uniref:Uncharacterized protein n=1 Tax=Hyalomma asiaticum TaxID=266040 RepID=A0ACB7SFZ5_HYAAI|nr:hypothetical protein HPB50_017418 [Hyalomma asiaticum]